MYDVSINLWNTPLVKKEEMSRSSSHLSDLVERKDWQGVIARIVSHPEEACSLNSNNETPLHQASEFLAPLEVIEAILSSYPGAASKTDKWDFTPLHNAISRNADPSVVNALLKAYPKAASMLGGSTGGMPLHDACYEAGNETVSLLLQAYPDAAWKQDFKGCLPIHIAAGNNADPAVIIALLNAFPEAAEVQSSDGCTPLHRACSNACIDPKCVKAILEAYPEAVFLKDSNQCTPLHRACNLNADVNPSSVRLILDAHPDTAILTDSNGFTPLHYLCWSYFGSGEVAKILLEANICGISMRNSQNQTPLELFSLAHEPYLKAAIDRSRSEVPDKGTFDMLNKEEGLIWNKACLLIKATYHGTVGDTQHNSKKFLMLHACAAIDKCGLEIIRVAAKLYPEQMNEADEQGNLPLHIAAGTKGLDESVANHHLKFLIEAYPEGAFERNSQGKLAFQLAVETSKKWTSGIECLFRASLLPIASMETDYHLYPSILSFLAIESQPTSLFELLRADPSIMKDACFEEGGDQVQQIPGVSIVEDSDT